MHASIKQELIQGTSSASAAAAPASAQSRLGHVPALDGIRGVAILLVLAYHASGHPSGGFFGVDVFFVLSGFLITTLLLEEIADTGRVGFRRFFARRARRLLPALIPFLVVVALFHRSQPERAAADLGAGLFYATNIIRAAGASDTLPTIGHLWSLAEEEQFYLLWPAVLVVLLRWKPHRLAQFLAASIVAVSLYRAGLTVGGATHERIYFAPDSHADPIIIGCYLAVIRSTGRLVPSRAWLASVPVLVTLVVTTEHYTTVSLLIGTTAVSLCAAGLIAAALETGSLAARLLASRLLVWVGTISYSLYIWQQLIHKFAPNPLVTIAVSIFVAWLSYRYIEQRFRRRRATVDPSRLQPSAVAAAQR